MKLTKSILSPAREGGPSSVSRRLRSKGGASPFFITKKRGCGFENPEPSSPKVTCIGQVRVKTKKKVKRSGSVSRKREVSFRKIEQDEQQRWVHLPMALSCFCFSITSERGGEKQGDGENGFARWLVSVDDGKRKEIELVVGDDEEEEETIMRSSRRHVFEDIEVKDDRIELKGQSLEELQEGARVSICIPPKNALLLMRCRSDPVKMAALANLHIQQEEEEEEEEENVVACEEKVQVFEEKEIPQELEITTSVEEKGEDDVESNMSSFEHLLVQENTDNFVYEEEEDCPMQQDTPPDKEQLHLPPSAEPETETETEEEILVNNEEENQAPENGQEAEEAEEILVKSNQEMLPECLLLMMCEPKLSMEVSKETWVCTTHEPVVKRRISIDYKPHAPPRSSLVEQKLVNAAAYEPFVLTRCKSEPMRTAAAKLMPDSCFWKNAMRKLEPRVGAAGIGF